MFSITNGHDTIHFEIAQHFPKGDNQPFDEYFLRVWGQSGFISFDKQVSATRFYLEELHDRLQAHYRSLHGICNMHAFSYDEDFSLMVTFYRTGRVRVISKMMELKGLRNHCTVEFETDQTFIAETLRDMKTTFGF